MGIPLKQRIDWIYVQGLVETELILFLEIVYGAVTP